ncbi:stage V sporulation protein B [Paenibacillus sp. HJGM_3]|uniref:stage V sporulation protein B n=1 Tax=Paenibacillus sp. HJGM_3 TaxID=3379816 RepID=UPI00385D7EFC
MDKQSFIKGTMILLAAGIVNRILGFIPRITLPRVIGAEGVGLYQLGYPFMIVVLTLITGGIPLAVAKLVAEAESEGNAQRIRTILKASLSITVSLSLLFMAVCMAAAPWITTRLLTDARVYDTFVSMSPILPIVAISSVFRGYFQGRQNMIPSAVSGIVETVTRIVAMLLFAYLLLPFGVEKAAAGAMIGVVFGELCGMLVLLYHHNRNPLRRSVQNWIATAKEHRFREQLSRIISISVPVTGSRLVGSTSYLLESIMIAQSLALAGIATGVATAQYGMLQGMVIPILLLPGALTYSLSVSLVPSLSEAAAKNDRITIHKRLHQSLKLALVSGAPFVVLMYILAEPICYYMYGNIEAARMLKLMAPVALFIYFQGPLQATLQALDRPGTALMNTFIGAAVKLSLIVWLASQPQWGILGAVVAINANIILVTLLHWNSVSRHVKFRMDGVHFFKAGIGMLIMAACCHFTMYGAWTDQTLLKFLAACLIGSLVYLTSIVLLGMVDREDVGRIPWIGRFFRS